MPNTKATDQASLVGSFVPAGVIMPFGGATAPSGWLLCDGAAISQTTYAALYAAISTAWGNPGGGSFNLPDLAGRFLRGKTNNVARDPDYAIRTAANTGGNTAENVGSVQPDAFYAHKHDLGFSSVQDYPGPFMRNDVSSNWRDVITSLNSDMVRNSGGNETRPKNANVNYIIKY